MQALINIAERGVFPDLLLRKGIKNLISARRDGQIPLDSLHHAEEMRELVRDLSVSPIAVHQEDANSQHYEVPSGFYGFVLGEHKKYSSCYFREGVQDLDTAERDSLEQIIERAQIKDGMRILDLGCGWGSLTLFAAEMFPNSSITSISNSSGQREYIEKEALRRGLGNINVITADITEISIDTQFDRIVAIEMLEHMRNYKNLFSKISQWLKDDGKLFVHIFCTQHLPYLFEVKDSSDWMAKYFFTGGIMPSFDLFEYFQEDIQLEKTWKLSGEHYGKTAAHWLANLDKNKENVLRLFQENFNKKESNIWFNRWRLFFMSCQELFSFNDGEDWFVGHYLFQKE